MIDARASTILFFIAAALILIAVRRGEDLVFGGHGDALAGVIGASVSGMMVAVLGWIVRAMERE